MTEKFIRIIEEYIYYIYNIRLLTSTVVRIQYFYIIASFKTSKFI